MNSMNKWISPFASAAVLTVACSANLAIAEPKHGMPGQGKPGAAYTHDLHGPTIDVRDVRRTLERHRDLWQPASSLPPGIRKNLARGKPLPPGIAMKLDQRLLDRLPHYAGYEWRQVGRDLLLIAASGAIYEILENVLD
ncbi:anti-virulence regulator CigR family protein [Stutzerimonas balearica]|uniref:anti-virulence regulator CigR family protein n=1 Tax=Stutzerimonas balearica TaxID=74829 RepID=UPI0028A1BC08|nr:anti-virulence regulator CigR family protein [Stutzerimonas balearica]